MDGFFLNGVKTREVPQIVTANYRKPYFYSNRLQRPFKKYDQVPMFDLKTTDENMLIADN